MSADSSWKCCRFAKGKAMCMCRMVDSHGASAQLENALPIKVASGEMTAKMYTQPWHRHACMSKSAKTPADALLGQHRGMPDHMQTEGRSHQAITNPSHAWLKPSRPTNNTQAAASSPGWKRGGELRSSAHSASSLERPTPYATAMSIQL